jgi:hypothetical protein
MTPIVYLSLPKKTRGFWEYESGKPTTLRIGPIGFLLFQQKLASDKKPGPADILKNKNPFSANSQS